MKFSVDRLKNMNWKQFAVNHGEKIALGLVGIVVLLIVFMGTRWKTFQEKDPQQLIAEVGEQEQALAAATWPETEQALYTDKYDVNFVYDNTYSVVKADRFRYAPGHPMIWPLHRQQQPIEEPAWLAVEELIQTPGRFIMELPPEGQEAIGDGAVALAAEDAAPMTKEDAIAQGFAVKSPQQQYGAESGIDPMAYPEGYDPSMATEEDAGAYGTMGMMGMMGEGGSMMPEINARGVRFIAVRGVFPFRKQMEEIMKAKHDPTLKDARSLVDIANFEIQRQTAAPGPDPWNEKTSPWQTLDQSVGLKLLSEVLSYAQEIVDYNNTFWTITSPLPMRLVGDWSSYFVGHPKIKTMTQRQLELRALLNEELVKMQKQAPVTEIDGVGGFALAQRNVFGLQDQVAGNMNSKNMLLNNMSKILMPGEEEADSGMMGEVNYMLNSTEETPEHVLFRFFDFDVEPGKAYRYRVRLKLFNPNFNELPDNLIAQNVGEGEFRDTPWSEPTPIPTSDKILSEDSHVFVGEVLAARGRQEPKAKIDLYQWLADIGSTANKVLEVQVGQLIGQPKPPVEDEETQKVNDKYKDMLVEVLRPYQSFKPEPVELTTDVAVVDLAAPPGRLPKDFHSDLNAKELKPVSQVLVVNEFGELENRNPITQSEQHAQVKKYLKAEYEPWEYLKNALNPAAMMEEGAMPGDAGATGLIDYGAAMGVGPGGAAGRGGAAGAAGRGGAAGAAGRGGPGRRGANALRLNRGMGPAMP